MAKPYRSLTFKLVAVLCLTGVAALLCFFLCRLGGRALVNRVYMAPARVEARVNGDIGSFRSYVSENGVMSTDVAAIGAWNREHPYVRITVTGRDVMITSDSYGAEVVLSNSALALRTGMGTAYEFAVNFSDGVCTVGVYNFSENHLFNTVEIVSVVISALFFLICTTLYDRKVTRSIQRLSRQVRAVSQGNLQMQIIPQTRDEIGSLAADVDAMRLSIMERLRGEEAAWQANSQLITAISHDVRTPLTALMGYLDILSEESLAPETRDAYLEVCRHNAQRLKDLTDELFRFFLVFGQSAPDQNIEEFDAATLMEQMLFEAQAELTQQGFDVRLIPCEALRGTVRVDLSHLRRVFDNLFSNVRKYADPARPVTIVETVEAERLHVTIANYVPAAAGKVESTKIGLKTCEKLLTAMGGQFLQHREADGFSAEVVLPLTRQ